MAKPDKTVQVQENETLGKTTCNSYHKGLISLIYKRFLGINKKSNNQWYASKC